jgi:hypothetical protein
MAQKTMKEILEEAAASGGGGGGLPFGPHDCVIAESEYVEASTGSPMIKVRMDAVSGPAAGGSQYDRIVYSEKSKHHFFRKVMATGITAEDLGQLVVDDANPASIEQAVQVIAGWLEGRYVTIEVGPQSKGEYKGSPEVKKYSAYGQTAAPVAAPVAAPATPMAPPTPVAPAAPVAPPMPAAPAPPAPPF